MDEKFNIDDRYTDEAKFFVSEYMKMLKSPNFGRNDYVKNRADRLKVTKGLVKMFRTKNVDESEIVVKSKFDDYEIPVTVYKPNNVDVNGAPVTIFFHGGGWVYGSRKDYELLVTYLAEETKSIWLSVEYRLAPENKYPVPINDALSVTEWIIENKSQFGSATSKLGIAGDSAGGHLAATVTHQLKGKLDYQLLLYP